MHQLRMLAVFIFLSVALCLWRIIHPSGEIGTDLVFGWIGFLIRVCPKVRIRWDGISTFIAGTLAALLIAHLLFVSLARELRTREGGAQPGWHFRWTAIFVATMILMFTAGIAFIGVTHQSAWLLTSKTPLFGKSVFDRFATSQINLKFLGFALQGAASTSVFPNRADGGHDGPEQSWVLAILPYLGSGYQSWVIDQKRAGNDPVNAEHFKRLIPELLNPGFRNPPVRSAQGYGLNHYAGNSELFDSKFRISREDELFDQSNLIMIGEVNSEFVPWGQPENSRIPGNGINTAGGFGGVPGSTGTLFVMADGSVRVINNDIDPRVLRGLSQLKMANHPPGANPSESR